MSAAALDEMSLCWIFIATSSPSRVALWTCAMDAVPSGIALNSVGRE